MNCEQFRELVMDVSRDESLDVGILEGALSHADLCESCDALLEESELLTSELRALSARHASAEAPDRVEAALLTALRRERRTQRSALEIWPWTAIILGAVASVVLVLALTGRPESLWHPGASTNRIPLLGEHAAAVASSTSGRPEATEASAVTVPGEDTSDSFVPLSGTFDLASLNEDPIVRVVLSDQQLESLGLPVDDNGDEQVVADLIIANDGTPQAIRVVSW